MKVRETIHHGDYRHVREVEITATWSSFINGLITTGPYADHGDHANNRFVAKTFVLLLTTGKSNRGWRNFEVIEGLADFQGIST